MSNQQTNRINVVMTAAQIANVKAAIQTINANMPFLVGLTPEERKNLPKISVQNKVFTEDSIVAIQNNGSILPAYFGTAGIKNDYTLYNQLDELSTLISQVAEKVDDTRLLAGSEAYVSALLAFKLIKAAAEAGVPGLDTIADQLAARFVGQGVASVPTPNPNPNDTTSQA